MTRIDRVAEARFTVSRTPISAAAKNALGREAIEFEVFAATEAEAIARAQQLSSYAAREFWWRVTSVTDIAAALGLPTENKEGDRG